MRIIFKDDRQKRLYSSKGLLNAEFGDQLAKKIMQRLAEVDAATCLEELRQAPGKWHELTGDRKGQLACSLTGNRRLIFSPKTPPSGGAGGGLDWNGIVELTVVEVVDYH